MKKHKKSIELEQKKIFLEDIVTGKVVICWTNDKGKSLVLSTNGTLVEPKDPENLPILFDSRAEAKQALSNILADTSDLVTTEYLKSQEKAFKEAVLVPASKFVGQDFIIDERESGFDIRTQVVLKHLQRPARAVIEEMRYHLQAGIDDDKEALKALKLTIKDRELALNSAITEKSNKLRTFEDSIEHFDFSLL
jgi:hypothetical protein